MRKRTRRLGQELSRGALAAGLFCGLLALPASSWAEDAPAKEEPPRPPPLPPLAVTPPPPTRHLDLGVGFSLLSRLTNPETDDGPTAVRYPPSPGLALSARLDVFRYFRAGAYLLWNAGNMELSPGSLGLPGDPGEVHVTAYSFGLRLAPTLPLGPRARAWVSAGVGWGRLELGRFDVVTSSGSFQVRERSASHAELPLGLGASFDVIRNWLAVELEVTGAIYLGERGNSLNPGQAIDPLGRTVRVGRFPRIEATFAQTIGLALLL